MATNVTTPETPTNPTRDAINRENAQHSTGPKTAEGKDRIRFNALKHGCYSATVVLPHEDVAAYETLGTRLRREYHATTPAHEALLQILQNTEWRLRRIVALEANLFTLGATQNLDRIEVQFGPDLPERQLYALAEAAGYQANCRTFEQLSKQEARLIRRLNVLHKIADRLPETPDLDLDLMPKGEASGFVPSPDAAPQSFFAPKSGFVPSNSQKPLPQMPVFVGPLAEFKRKQWRVQHGLPAKVAK